MVLRQLFFRRRSTLRRHGRKLGSEREGLGTEGVVREAQ